MVLVYVPTKLGDFFKVNVTVNIAAHGSVMGNGSFIGTLWIITFYAPKTTKTIPVWGSPKKGKCPVKSVSEHMALYHTVFRKIGGFSMSIINVVLKCYQSLNYIQYYLGLWLMIPNKTNRISENRGFPTSICRSKGASFETIDPPGITPSTPSGEIHGGSNIFKPSIWSHKFGTETSGLPWT